MFLVGVMQHPDVGILGCLDDLKLEETAAFLGRSIRSGLPPAFLFGLDKHRGVDGGSVVAGFAAAEADPADFSLAGYFCAGDAHGVASREGPGVEGGLHRGAGVDDEVGGWGFEGDYGLLGLLWDGMLLVCEVLLRLRRLGLLTLLLLLLLLLLLGWLLLTPL